MSLRWEIGGEHSALYPIIQKKFKDEFTRLIQDQVTPWVFMTTFAGLNVKKADGKEIRYKGIEFEGSPEHVFWNGYIEPFLEQLAFGLIEAGMERSASKKCDLTPVLNEIQELLRLGVSNVYSEMADVDRRLRGKGFPQNVSLKNTDGYIHRMEAFIARRIETERRLWKPVPIWERIYENNKFLVWLLGFCVSVLGVIAAFAG